MNENNTISSNLTRIKNATDDIRSTLGAPEAAIEEVASDVANLSDSYVRMASDYNDLIIENNNLRQQIADITPKGTISITNNGTFNVSSYASAIVSVGGGGSGWITINKLQNITLAQPFATNGNNSIHAYFSFPVGYWTLYVDIIYDDGNIETRIEGPHEWYSSMTVHRFYEDLQQTVDRIVAIEVRDEEYIAGPEIEMEYTVHTVFDSGASTYQHEKNITLYWCQADGTILDSIDWINSIDDEFIVYGYVPSFTYYRVGFYLDSDDTEYFTEPRYLTFNDTSFYDEVTVYPRELYFWYNTSYPDGAETFGMEREVSLIDYNSGSTLASETTTETNGGFTLMSDEVVPNDSLLARVQWIDGNSYDSQDILVDCWTVDYDLGTIEVPYVMSNLYLSISDEMGYYLDNQAYLTIIDTLTGEQIWNDTWDSSIEFSDLIVGHSYEIYAECDGVSDTQYIDITDDAHYVDIVLPYTKTVDINFNIMDAESGEWLDNAYIDLYRDYDDWYIGTYANGDVCSLELWDYDLVDIRGNVYCENYDDEEWTDMVSYDMNTDVEIYLTPIGDDYEPFEVNSEDCTLYDYIENPGTAWINTKVYADTFGYRFILDCMPTDIENSGEGGDEAWAIAAYHDGGFRVGCRYGGGQWTVENEAEFSILPYENCENYYRVLINAVNNVTIPDLPIALLSQTEYGHYPQSYRNLIGRIYRCQIYDPNDNMIRDYVPAVHEPSGEIGLLDQISNLFYVSPNGDSFNVGNDEITDLHLEVLDEMWYGLNEFANVIVTDCCTGDEVHNGSPEDGIIDNLRVNNAYYVYVECDGYDTEEIYRVNDPNEGNYLEIILPYTKTIDFTFNVHDGESGAELSNASIDLYYRDDPESQIGVYSPGETISLPLGEYNFVEWEACVTCDGYTDALLSDTITWDMMTEYDVDMEQIQEDGMLILDLTSADRDDENNCYIINDVDTVSLFKSKLENWEIGQTEEGHIINLDGDLSVVFEKIDDTHMTDDFFQGYYSLETIEGDEEVITIEIAE